MTQQSVIPQTIYDTAKMMEKLPLSYQNIVKGMILGFLITCNTQRSV